MNPIELATFILSTYPDKHITPMKLQKLAYYANAWTLVAGQDWINAEFEKWLHGPVNNAIYQKYKKYGSGLIPIPTYAPGVESSKAKLLQFILDNYVDYSAFTLSAMTHNEAPWQNTNDNQVISDALIKDYYSKQPFAQNLIGSSAGKPFHVLHSNNWHSFVLDMDEQEAEKYNTYPSFEEFSKKGKKASEDFSKLVQQVNEIFD